MLSSIRFNRRRSAPALLVACVLWAAGAPAVPAQAEDLTDDAYAQVNAALINGHIVPAYRRLASATDALAVATTSYCAGDTSHSLETVQAVFKDANTAWMGAEHLGFGPAEFFMRNLRMNFWPQARGKVSDAIDAALAPDADAKPVNERSFALQGLPAMEHLVFASPQPEAKTARCDLAVAVSANMQAIASDVLAEWGESDASYSQTTSSAGPNNATYPKASDVTLDLFRSLHDGLQRISTLKLDPALGKDADTARPPLAEARLSDGGMDNIRQNLVALEQLYLGPSDDGLTWLTQKTADDPKLDALMRKAFQKTRETADSVTLALPLAVSDAQERPKLEMLSKQVRALRQICADRLAPALNLSVGFNSLDGD
ncbi:MAG: imelysin family protein [Candidatus Phaeomarinobacter sp.]